MKNRLNANVIRHAIPVALLLLGALLALVAGFSAVRTANAPQTQSISVPPTIEAKILGEEAEFQQWAALRAAWDNRPATSRYDTEHPDVAFRADLAHTLTTLPAWVAETLPPVTEWSELRADVAHEADRDRVRAERDYEQKLADWSEELGYEIDEWGGWGSASDEDDPNAKPRTIVPEYPHGWWQSDRLKDHQHIDALWAIVQSAGETPQARAEFIRQAYGPIDSRALPADYVQVLTAPRPTGTVVALSVTSGALTLTAIAGAVLLHRRRKGASS